MTTRKAAKTEYRPAAPDRRQTAALTEERPAEYRREQNTAALNDWRKVKNEKNE